MRARTILLSMAALVLTMMAANAAPQVKLSTQAQDPYGFPRPGANQKNVPLRTSFYFEFGVTDSTDAVLPSSVTMKLKPANGSEFFVLKPNKAFQPGYSGSIGTASPFSLNIDSQRELSPDTTYTLTLTAGSKNGGTLPGGASYWDFCTEPAPTTHTLSCSLDLTTTATRWTGGFFTGFCQPSFCTSEKFNNVPGYELMDEVRKQSPKAWSVERDWWITGSGNSSFSIEPNVVRELETRRINAMESTGGGIRLHVEDFFGHEQYGIASGRSVSADYHPGDIVQIADSVTTDSMRSTTATVISVDAATSSVLVSSFPAPADGWHIGYTAALPTQEDPQAPGLFPPGGCYLLKSSPSGTPRYYWGRVDKQEDLIQKRFNRRLHVNFADAPGDLSIDGRAWTTTKDYAEMQEVARAITSHFIERYGDACLDFVWSIGNEPDLAGAFWRGDDANFTAFQKYYDYTVDGILRAFENHGYDSNRVFIGGLEAAFIRWGGTTNLCKRLLAHCSPTATFAGALAKNAAYADARLNGKRSQRVETLCAANNGKGSPINFISVHAYTSSPNMADWVAYAKQLALDIDPVTYAKLWVNSHESCPNWAPPADVAANDSYLGNGYFPTWCADVARRQLLKASQDARFGYGETILTFWPWPNSNLGGLNGNTQVLNVDDTGDGISDRTVTVASPILRFLGLMGGMGDLYRVLPETTVAGHTVSGFASRGTNDVKILLYSHEPLDTQSRSDRAFDIKLTLSGLSWSKAYAQEYRFDKTKNTFYNYAKELGKRPAFTPAEADQVTSLSLLHMTKTYTLTPTSGKYAFTPLVLGNGANFIILTSSAPTPTPTPTPTATPTRTPTRTPTPTPTPQLKVRSWLGYN